MAGISATGSSIDVNAIVTGLLALERQPITRLDAKETSYKAKLTAFSLIKSQVSNFQAAAKALGSTSSSIFLGYKATSSDTSVFTASAGTSAVSGTYALEVSKLAQSQKLVAAGQTSSNTAIGTGTATTVTFDFGTISQGTTGTLTNGVYSNSTFTTNGAATTSITIDATNNTLEGIRNAINTANFGVSATIVNDGSGTPYRLALSSNNTGANQSLKITTNNGDASVNNLLAYNPGGLPADQKLVQNVAAQNAEFTVNGIAIVKTSNTVTDAIQGVTLSLNKLTITPATLTVARDTTAVTESISSFVKAYNDLYSALKNSSAYKSKSALEGDGTIRTLQSQLRTIASDTVTGGTLNSLSALGISFQTDGTLLADTAKVSAALTANFADVANLFNSATGYATKSVELTTTTLAIDGTIANRTNGINQYIKEIGDRRTILEARLVGVEKLLRTQYSSLNVTLGQFQQTSAYLARQLG